MWAALVTAFGWIWNGISSAAAALASAAMSAAIAVGQALRATAHVVTLFGQHAWGFLRNAWDKVLRPSLEKIFLHPIQSLKDLWEHVLKPIGVQFNRWIDKAHEWLKTKFGPVLCWFQKTRKWLDLVYTRYLRPILEILDVARAVLKILSTLGVDWAKRLDAKLAALEQWITDRYLELRARVTTAEEWINRIVDLNGLFQRVILLRSLLRDAGDAWNVLVGAGSDDVSDDERGGVRDAAANPDPTDVDTVMAPYFAQLGTFASPLMIEIRTLYADHLAR